MQDIAPTQQNSFNSVDLCVHLRGQSQVGGPRILDHRRNHRQEVRPIHHHVGVRLPFPFLHCGNAAGVVDRILPFPFPFPCVGGDGDVGKTCKGP